MLQKKNKLDALLVEANRLSRLNPVGQHKRARKEIIGNDEVCASSDHTKTKKKMNRKGKSQFVFIVTTNIIIACNKDAKKTKAIKKKEVDSDSDYHSAATTTTTTSKDYQKSKGQFC